MWNAIFFSRSFSCWIWVSLQWMPPGWCTTMVPLLIPTHFLPYGTFIHHSNAKHAHKNVYATEVTISKWQSMKNEKWSLRAKAPPLLLVFCTIAAKTLIYTQMFDGGTTMTVTKQKQKNETELRSPIRWIKNGREIKYSATVLGNFLFFDNRIVRMKTGIAVDDKESKWLRARRAILVMLTYPTSNHKWKTLSDRTHSRA